MEREETVQGLESASGSAEAAGATAFTQDEIQAFTEKLQAWGDALPEREQELLARVIAGPADAGDDVSGYMLGGWTALSATLVQKVSTVNVTQDVTTNKAKTADKAFNAMDGYIRG